ncbi:MAG TPA: extracellular solute-binding protein [Trueperaceae bacterium]
MVLVLALLSIGFAQTDINFAVWNYSLDTVQDNIAKFEEAHPDIDVSLSDYTWPDFHDTMVLRFRGGNAPDVLYVGQDWLPAWASAGWLTPLSEACPDLTKYNQDAADYAVSDMTYQDQVYGLPYYADTISFLYNAQVLEEHDIPVPETWEDVLQASLQLKEAGMEKPFVYEYNQELPNFYDAFVAQVYGRGGDMFDEDLNPLFDDPESNAFKHLQWLQEANTEHGIVQLVPHETDVIRTMNTGEHAFTVVYNYVLAAMNEEATQPLAGDFALALMPGEAHQTLGFAKFYSISSAAASDPEKREAACEFIEYMGGGDYQVATRWAAEKGLGFAQLPLFEDPAVIDSWNDWVDMDVLRQQVATARSGTWTEWTSIWSAYFRPLLAQAMAGQMSVEEAMNLGAEKWLEYREMVRGG